MEGVDKSFVRDGQRVEGVHKVMLLGGWKWRKWWGGIKVLCSGSLKRVCLDG